MSAGARPPLDYRWARPDDADAVVPLIHESSREMIDFAFRIGAREPSDFVRRAFVTGKGVFGWPRQFVAVDAAGTIVATITGYPGAQLPRLAFESLVLAFRYYRFVELFEFVRRSLVIAPLFIRPRKDALFLANACVIPSQRGKGVFGALTAALAREMSMRMLRVFELDVSFRNRPAERAYVRLGFEVVGERPYAGPLPLDGFRRMRRALPTDDSAAPTGASR